MNKIGKNTKIWDYVTIVDSTIGHDVNIGNCCEIYKANIGDYTRVGFGSFICEGVTIGKRCFISPRVCFTNDKFPYLKKKGEVRKLLKTVVDDDVVIGANVTILPGLKIGKAAFIGAGSVVTKDVPTGHIVYGNPAKSPPDLHVRIRK
jgi:UDP-2-acetamido-3-amino-2,3-dideoxy-glucuronate N-acetyltransferase